MYSEGTLEIPSSRPFRQPQRQRPSTVNDLKTVLCAPTGETPEQYFVLQWKAGNIPHVAVMTDANRATALFSGLWSCSAIDGKAIDHVPVVDGCARIRPHLNFDLEYLRANSDNAGAETAGSAALVAANGRK
jgi:hypothetical protein